MDQEVTLRIVLENPTRGVDFGIQDGSGTFYTTILKQKSQGTNLHFEFKVRVKTTPDTPPIFLGSVAQGSPKERFVYIDIGWSAGQTDSIWRRRLKIPLKGITWEMIRQSQSNPSAILEISVPGIGKDGGPSCGSFKGVNGWKLANNSEH